jgi:molecular chaperone DnaK
MAADNMTLGRFRLEGIPPAPRGVPQIDVTFDIDANGILHVSAKDKATGKEQKITITASTNLNKQDVERLVREAQQHAAEDQRRRELADARNQADTLAYQAEKALRELGEQIPAAERARIEAQINDLRTAMQGEDVARIRQLSEIVQQMANALGQQASARQAGGPDVQGNGVPDEVIEGEFTEA